MWFARAFGEDPERVSGQMLGARDATGMKIKRGALPNFQRHLGWRRDAHFGAWVAGKPLASSYLDDRGT